MWWCPLSDDFDTLKGQKDAIVAKNIKEIRAMFRPELNEAATRLGLAQVIGAALSFIDACEREGDVPKSKRDKAKETLLDAIRIAQRKEGP